MSNVRLHDPWWLLLWLPLVVVTWIAWRREGRVSVLFSSAELVRDLPVTTAQRMKRFLPWVRALGLGLIVVAIARPQAGLSQYRIRTEGIAIMMCLDRSGSMEAMDFVEGGERVNRLSVVKRVFRDFVVGTRNLPGRPDDLIGLVTFGGFAEGKVPLTLDHGALLEVLDSVEITQPVYDSRGGVVNERFLQEERATAIGDGVVLGVDRLRASTAKSKVLVLLSDGENTAGMIDPADAAEVARTYGIKIYSIGIGTTGRVPFPTVDRFGRRILMSQVVKLDEETLKMLAEKSGGRYFSAQDTQSLEGVYAAIDKLEKSVSEGLVYSEYRELFPWWVIGGVALVIIDVLLRSTWFRRWP